MKKDYMKKLEKKFIKIFLEMKYPAGTHYLHLDICFDYYNGLCYKFIHNSKNLSNEVYDLDDEIETKILNFISENKGNDDGINMSIYLNMLKSAILILNKYYSKDGLLK